MKVQANSLPPKPHYIDVNIYLKNGLTYIHAISARCLDVKPNYAASLQLSVLIDILTF